MCHEALYLWITFKIELLCSGERQPWCKNIISFFSFSFITQNVRIRESSEGESKTAELYTHRAEVWIFIEQLSSSALDQSLSGYVISMRDTRWFSSIHIRQPVVYAEYSITFPSTHVISAEFTNVQFTSGAFSQILVLRLTCSLIILNQSKIYNRGIQSMLKD